MLGREALDKLGKRARGERAFSIADAEGLVVKEPPWKFCHQSAAAADAIGGGRRRDRRRLRDVPGREDQDVPHGYRSGHLLQVAGASNVYHVHCIGHKARRWP